MARRLHRALEGFRPGGQLGTGMRTLGRIFRDDDEFSASGDLAGEIEQALAQSGHLIVLCSPAAARSRWVAAEVEAFIRSNRRDRIIAVLVSGTPNATDREEECLPAPLRSDQSEHEPLGVDLRDAPMNRSVVKIAAALLGVPFDRLWDRQRRRLRLRRATLGGAGLGALALAGLATFNWWQTAEQRRINLAEESRRIAEAITEVEARGRLLAAKAADEPDPGTSLLIALEAWNVADPLTEAGLDTLAPLDPAARTDLLRKVWRDLGHNVPDRAVAAAAVRRGAASLREVWSRQFPSGKHELAIGDAGNIVAHATESGRVTIERIDRPEAAVQRQVEGGVRALALSPDASETWVAAERGLYLIDNEDGTVTELARFDRDDTLVRGAFAPDSPHAILSVETQQLFLADLRAGTVVPVGEVSRLPAFAFGQDQVLVADGSRLRAVSLDDGAVLRDSDFGVTLSRIYRDGGDLLTLVSNDDRVLVQDTASGARVTFSAENASGWNSEVAFDRESGWLFLQGGGDHATARRLPQAAPATSDTEDEEELWCGRRMADMALDEVNRHLAIGTDEGEICVWSLPGLEKVATFETGREIETLSLSGDTVVTSFRDGGVLAQHWASPLAFERLDGCEQPLLDLLFDFRGLSLIGWGGFTGLCVWDLAADPPRVRDAPGLSLDADWMFMSWQTKNFLFLDHYGAIFELTNPKLEFVRQYEADDAVFAEAGFTGSGTAVLGRTVEGRMILWPGPDATPIELEDGFDAARVFPSAKVDRYVPVISGAGDVFLYDAGTGRRVTQVDLPLPALFATIEEQDGTDVFMVLTDVGIALMVPLTEIGSLPGLITEPRAHISGDVTRVTEASAMAIASAIDGDVVVIEALSGLRLLQIKPEDVGMTYFVSAVMQPRGAGGQRRLAALARPEVSEHTVPMIATLPESLRPTYDMAAMEEVVQAPRADAGLIRDYWERVSEAGAWRVGVELAPRCLTPDERAALRLDPDPPCWCAGKSYPPPEVWSARLGRNPFTDPRADGRTCNAHDRAPWSELADAAE